MQVEPMMNILKKLTFGSQTRLFQFSRTRVLTHTIFLAGIALLLAISSWQDIVQGYALILMHPSILVTDYLRVAGLYPTLLNVWISTFAAIYIYQAQKTPLTGSMIAGILTITGFAFFGKNLLNTLPIWFGFFLYTKANRLHLKDSLGTFFFSSGIAPIFSFLLFGTTLPLYFSIPISLIAGTLTGFLVPIIASLTSKFHQGFNLYNTGFAIGFIAMLHGALLRALNISLATDGAVSFAYHQELMFITLFVSFLAIIVGITLDPFSDKQIFFLSKKAVPQPTDFVSVYGLGQTLINIGMMGLYSLFVIVILGLRISGPMMSALYTILGFAAFGKTIRTSIPLMLGAYVATLLTKYSIYDLGPSIALFFVTALSPITGKFGIVFAFIAGFFHIMLTEYAFYLQGGFALYNNGFTAGFVAALIAVIAQQFNHLFKKEV
jgi:hypothetical protein